jgi:hypothetical protein
MSGEVTNLPEDIVLHMLSFLGHCDLFQRIALVSKQFNKLVGPEYPHWRYLYEDTTLRIENNIPLSKPHSEIKTSNEYQTLFMKRILPILQQKRAFLSKIDKLAEECSIPAELYAKIRDLLSKSMQLHIGFNGTNLGYHGTVANYPLGTSRYGTKIVDVPTDDSVVPNNIVMQLNMSLVKDTFCAERYNLPTTGHLYYICDQQSPSCVYVPHNNLKRETNNNVDVRFRMNFVIESAVDILDTVPEEDFPALEKLYNLQYQYSENDEPVHGYLEAFIEGVRHMKYLHSKDGQTACNLQMFGTPYYTQHQSQHLGGMMLFMYYTSGGNELAYVTINKNALMRQDFSSVHYDSQY